MIRGASFFMAPSSRYEPRAGSEHRVDDLANAAHRSPLRAHVTCHLLRVLHEYQRGHAEDIVVPRYRPQAISVYPQENDTPCVLGLHLPEKRPERPAGVATRTVKFEDYRHGPGKGSVELGLIGNDVTVPAPSRRGPARGRPFRLPDGLGSRTTRERRQTGNHYKGRADPRCHRLPGRCRNHHAGVSVAHRSPLVALPF